MEVFYLAFQIEQNLPYIIKYVSFNQYKHIEQNIALVRFQTNLIFNRSFLKLFE